MLAVRFMQKIAGKCTNGYFSDSQILNIGYCCYCAEDDPMEPYMRAKETVQILQFDRVWVRFVRAKDNLSHKIPLQKDMILHIHR